MEQEAAATSARRALNWHETLGVIGNITSITGISLLWFRDTVNWSNALPLVPLVAAIASMSLGILTLGVIALRNGYAKLALSRSLAWKIVYWTAATPIVLGIASALIAGVVWLVQAFFFAVFVRG